MFKKQLDDKIEHPKDEELGKKNIETMEKLVEEMKENGDYIGDQKKVLIKKSKKIKKNN